jgi:DNA-binding NarL/FixJ family response regulator
MCCSDTKNKKIKEKILIIDDDNIIRSTIKSIVQKTLFKLKLDYDILEGCDGEDMIRLVVNDQDGTIKVIFTDENMKFIEGSQAILAIRDIKQRNEIKVVSITSLDDDYSIMNILNCGADKVIQKPAQKVLIEELLKIYLV